MPTTNGSNGHHSEPGELILPTEERDDAIYAAWLQRTPDRRIAADHRVPVGTVREVVAQRLRTYAVERRADLERQRQELIARSDHIASHARRIALTELVNDNSWTAARWVGLELTALKDAARYAGIDALPASAEPEQTSDPGDDLFTRLERQFGDDDRTNGHGLTAPTD